MRLLIILLFTSMALMAQVPYEVITGNGATDSDSLQLNGLHIVGIDVASDFNGDSLYILTSDSFTGTYERVYLTSDGTPLGFPAVAGRRYVFKAADYYMFEKYIKIQHNSAADSEQTHTVYLGNYN